MTDRSKTDVPVLYKSIELRGTMPCRPAGTGSAGEESLFRERYIPADDCSAWLKTRKGRKRDSEAASLEADLRNPETFDAACARLAQLARLGSAYASWLLGDRLARGEGLEQDGELALPLLEKAARAGIGPACLAVFRLLDPKGDGTGRGALDWLVRGTRAGSFHCAALLAGFWNRGRLCLDDEEAAVLCRLLGKAAFLGSWDCLDSLLNVMQDKRQMTRLQATHGVAVHLLADAAQSGFVPAMLRLARVLADGGVIISNRELALVWAERAWRAGSAEGGCLLAELRMMEGEAAGRIDDLLRKSAGKGCHRAGLHLAILEYSAAPDRTAQTRALKRMLEACRGSEAADLACESGWAMCASPAGEMFGQLEDGLALLRAAAGQGAVRAEGLLARAALLGLTGEGNAVRNALDRLEELKRRGWGPACGMLAEAHLFGLYGLRPSQRKGLAEAVEGLRTDDRRSAALLCLNREGVLGRDPDGVNPLDEDSVVPLGMFLIDRQEPLMHAHEAVQDIRMQYAQTEPAEAGRALASVLRHSVLTRDSAALSCIRQWIEALPQGSRTDAAMRALSESLGLRDFGIGSGESHRDAISFARMAERRPAMAGGLLMYGRHFASLLGGDCSLLLEGDGTLRHVRSQDGESGPEGAQPGGKRRDGRRRKKRRRK